MIPEDWRPYQRESDGELVGYLVPHLNAAGDEASVPNGALVVPTSLIGTPLGPPQTPAAARRVLTERGLAALAERWWCRLPKPLPATGPVAVRQPEPAWDWRPVVLVEVSPTEARIRLAMAAPAELTVQVPLPVPVGGLLRRLPPG